MRALLQRVSEANVSVDKAIHSSINKGLLILIGIENEDSEEDIEWLVKKISQMRIFEDVDGKMNNSILDISGELLVVSQFTLHANTKKGNRPSFIKAARPEKAIPLYENFIESCQNILPTKAGVFGAEMKVALINDGPVTIWLDSKNKE
ncbi:D-aminoacyl-tRNA deacylase [Bacteroidia bacterium]|nr:D-aminoacyl-tRNA deacylase [Bacteroidia bacterium]MDB4107256.1 D-aminoacyl-tRNA deacylase [Bacteroidia bacterium]MDB9882427.1 D-aminoacyl-tRNA deacylase [Bacteroidia bacterium]